jgi:hypothetical protein
MSHTCPACADTNTQKVSVAFESGLFVNQSTTIGAATGIGSGPTMLGIAKTRGTSQSATSMKLSPPEKISINKLWMAWIFPQNTTELLKFFIPGARKGIVWFYRQYRDAQHFNNHEHPRLMAEWHSQFVCTACGHRFIPSATQADSIIKRS